MKTDAASPAEPTSPTGRSMMGSPPRPPSEGFSQVLGPTSHSSVDMGGTMPAPPSALTGALALEPGQAETLEGAGPVTTGVLSSVAFQLFPSPSALAGAQVADALLTQAIVARRGGEELPGEAKRASRGDPLDPATLPSTQLAPPFLETLGWRPAAAPDAPVQVRTHASLEEVLPAIVRRIAWSGDGRNGTLRLEFGAGALSGGTLVVHADDGRVRVELRAPPGADTSAWRERIVSRLEERRLTVDEVVVE